jgi:metal-responsive CopG/Arc/MetJ family transcriptional regulator
MTVRVSVPLADKDVAALDELIDRQLAKRSEVLHAGLQLILRDEREGELDEH